MTDASDPKHKPLTLKEAITAMQEFYYDGKPLTSDDARNILHFLRSYETVVDLMENFGDRLKTAADSMRI